MFLPVCVTVAVAHRYEVGEQLRVLPCEGQHHFHKECLDGWLRINATCPSCREVVVSGTSQGVPGQPPPDTDPVAVAQRRHDMEGLV